VTRAVQQLIVFLASLPGARLTAAGAQGNLIGGDASQERAAGQTAMAAGAQSTIAPGVQRVERALEAEAFDGNIVSQAGLEE
jgi:hypothetical protein